MMTAITVSRPLLPPTPDWLAQAGLGERGLQVARAHQRGAERLIEGLALAASYLGALFARPTPAQAGTPGPVARFKRGAQRYLLPVDWELERYLAASTDCADLEHRMRTWARTHRSNRF